MGYDSNGFNYQGNSIASNFDTTYSGNASAATTNFQKYGVDIGNSYTPAATGYTNNNNIGFTSSGSNLTALMSTSKPIPTIYYSGMIYGKSSYTFLYATNTSGWSYLRQVKPATWVSNVTINTLALGGGGGGGSQTGDVNEGSGGGGAGTYLTCQLNNTDTYYYFRCGAKGVGQGGDNWGTQGGTTQIYINNSNRMYIYGGLGGSGSDVQAHDDIPTTTTFGSSGGACAAYSNNQGRWAHWPSNRSHYAHNGSVASSINAYANEGGFSGGGNRGGGGGGGAGEEAQNQDQISGGDGGDGKTWSYTNYTYCGGGGGKPRAGSGKRNGYGGSGGGGNAGDRNESTSSSNYNFATYWGSGGGAGGANGGGGDGYNGIIITAVVNDTANFVAE